MEDKKVKVNNLIQVENFINYNQLLDINSNTFKKLMFFYLVAIRELETKFGSLRDEFKIFYHYDLIDNIKTRIKEPESIIDKMKKRNLSLTYKDMIENINDIAGIRVICPLKKDIFAVKKLIEKFPDVNVIKEKDYVTHPKKSGYSSYHLIVDVPIVLSQQSVYVKAEIQIRTVAMDFWASLEHKMKYKPKEALDKKKSNEWVSCAKLINKLEDKIMLLN